MRLQIKMFLPNNTRIEKVMNMTDDGEDELVEQRVITEMVYWDMVGRCVFLILILEWSPCAILIHILI